MIIHLRIEGRVQRVFYRQSTVRQACLIGNISGWVRNRQDGSVEILAEGDDNSLALLKEWCFTGSPNSHVTSVEELSVPSSAELPEIIPGIFRKEDTV